MLCILTHVRLLALIKENKCLRHLSCKSIKCVVVCVCARAGARVTHTHLCVGRYLS